jgi:predicted Zn-dependent protease
MRRRDGVCTAPSTSTPTRCFARGYLGISYAFSGDYDAALTSAVEAMHLSPRGPLLIIWHLCKGWAALLAGRDEEAVEYATQAAEANPEFPDIYAVLASANGHLGKGSPLARRWISCRGAYPP